MLGRITVALFFLLLLPATEDGIKQSSQAGPLQFFYIDFFLFQLSAQDG